MLSYWNSCINCGMSATSLKFQIYKHFHAFPKVLLCSCLLTNILIFPTLPWFEEYFYSNPSPSSAVPYMKETVLLYYFNSCESMNWFKLLSNLHTRKLSDKKWGDILNIYTSMTCNSLSFSSSLVSCLMTVTLLFS